MVLVHQIADHNHYGQRIVLAGAHNQHRAAAAHRPLDELDTFVATGQHRRRVRTAVKVQINQVEAGKVAHRLLVGVVVNGGRFECLMLMIDANNVRKRVVAESLGRPNMLVLGVENARNNTFGVHGVWRDVLVMAARLEWW